jgi:hypothetical protein
MNFFYSSTLAAVLVGLAVLVISRPAFFTIACSLPNDSLCLGSSELSGLSLRTSLPAGSQCILAAYQINREGFFAGYLASLRFNLCKSKL